MGQGEDTFADGSNNQNTPLQPLEEVTYSLQIESAVKIENEEEITHQLVNMPLEKTLEAIEGQNTYYRNLIITAVLAMLAASTTTYTLGLYTALPEFQCP